MENKLFCGNPDGMPGVVPPLITCDDGNIWRQQVNDLAFSLVPPLRTNDGDVHTRSFISVRAFYA